MKNKITIIIISLAIITGRAQTMKWIPMEAGMASGPCAVDNSHKQQQLCYALQYTPAASGTLTSYTTGFYVSCTSMGSPISKNQSCTMINNVHITNGCDASKIVLMNSSGNSGTNTKVESGVPVILHEVCFDIPYGESITIKEDPITDLTTSIDQLNETPKTEFPSYEEITIRRDRYDESKPMLLDFKGIPAGDYVAQLDWSTSLEKNNSYFNIERSFDGNEFEQIGQLNATEKPGPVNSYQFFDKAARPGKNYYRLQQVDIDGKDQYSPVRTVDFAAEVLTVHLSPNPADDYLEVAIQSPTSKSHIKLIDATGRVVVEEKNDNKLLTVKLDVKKINPGTYTLVVETDMDKYAEKVIIAH